MTDALTVRDMSNTDERVTISVRPIVALLAQQVEASFARHDGDHMRTSWTGDETLHPYLVALRDAGIKAEDSIPGHVQRGAVIRAGAWAAFALAFLSAELPVAPEPEDTVIDLASASDLLGLAAMVIEGNAADVYELHTIFEGAFADEGTGNTGHTEQSAADLLIYLLKIVGRHEALEGSR